MEREIRQGRDSAHQESEVEELVNFASFPSPEAGDQEMDDTIMIKGEGVEKVDIIDEDAPVSTRLRRPKKNSAPKEKLEIETTPPRATRKVSVVAFPYLVVLFSLRSNFPSVFSIASIRTLPRGP